MPRIMRPSQYTSRPSFRMLPEDYAGVKGGRPKRKDQLAFGMIFLTAIILFLLAPFKGWLYA